MRTEKTMNIYNSILESITKGEFEKKLPSERTLSVLHNANRNTIREILSVLEGKGLIIRKKGIGTLINKQGEENA